jgi:hypothetical protein
VTGLLHVRVMVSDLGKLCALGGTRTPNLLIRSQMLYPLSYERSPNSIPRQAPGLPPVQSGCARGSKGAPSVGHPLRVGGDLGLRVTVGGDGLLG